jgi:hypothetical protein
VDAEKVRSAVLQFASQSKTFEDIRQTEENISLHVKDQAAGDKWIEWQIRSHTAPSGRYAAGVTYLAQTVFFRPHGLPGFLYWYLLYPFHVISFRNRIRSIAERSKKI